MRPPPPTRHRRDRARAAILWQALQNVWYGLSLGSVLLLAAIGLAITFGVMGVINMAHGEMVMLGAYATYVVQELSAPRRRACSTGRLLIAMPARLPGRRARRRSLIERCIIRFLYGRPLETLLATWGIIADPAAGGAHRSSAPTNREVGAPAWMSGASTLGGLTITCEPALDHRLRASRCFVALRRAPARRRFGLRCGR